MNNVLATKLHSCCREISDCTRACSRRQLLVSSLNDGDYRIASSPITQNRIWPTRGFVYLRFCGQTKRCLQYRYKVYVVIVVTKLQTCHINQLLLHFPNSFFFLTSQIVSNCICLLMYKVLYVNFIF